MDAFLDIEDPSDWPADFPHLRELEQLLRCPVCKEYLDTPMVVTNCGHTFCSLCVRRCLTQETKCPSCRASTTEGDLHPNRLVDSLLREFKHGRPQLLSTLRSANTHKPVEAKRKRPRIITRSAAKNMDVDTMASDEQLGTDNAIDLTSSDIEQMRSMSDFEIATVNSGMTPTAPTSTENDGDSDFMPSDIIGSRRCAPKSHTRSSHENSVLCPNCQSQVRSAKINWHLDRCLSGKSIDEPPPAAAASESTAWPTATRLQLTGTLAKFALPRPTKLAYSLLSEAKLRRTLRELGVPAKGDKHQMQARHVEWVNMYMANTDSETPLSHSVLLRRLATWEDAMARQPEPFRAPPPATPGAVTDHTSKYADSFAALVAQARSTRPRPPTKYPL
ncbi:hypothetical protein BX661DRAFT_184237 [Kickxella alabastrina]|uniref:uncharacterized protein n=1 Tax=Kickxella alabastrina TaxID=61397 RepID=UPI00221E63D9|nr:uncharacterized protein BX661DRAFT_184237 [Kickxella alabastrina]KAI7825829.1 hypothetical protein BX661DRAFT_184237 [Kickxella alabastrina]KAJ1940308.1 E3 ubiquitin-protein ligase rad18 [Kickxella alabastrina]